MLPIILKSAQEWIKLTLYTFIIPTDMKNPMFINWPALVNLKPQWGIIVGEDDPNDKKMFFSFRK